MERPKNAFKSKDKEKVEYKNVSYRLPKQLLDKLDKHVTKDKSACFLVSQILEWALEDIKREKKK
jgi:Arc/MetJ-type ribon-helix-helix transcriptional regulator